MLPNWAISMKKSWFIDLALISIYKCILDITFIHYVLPVYEYEAQYAMNHHVNSSKVAGGYLIVILFMVLFGCIKKNATVSRFVIFVQLILIVVPYTVIYGAEDLPFWHIGMLLLGFASVIVAGRWLPTVRVRPPNTAARNVLIYAMVTIVAYVFIGLFVTGGLGRFNLNFQDVYEARDLYAKNMLPGFGYFVPWVAYTINMAWLVNAMRSSSKFQVVASLLLQVLIFAMTNFKSFLFVPFAVIGLIELAKRMDIRRAVLIGAPAIVGILVSLSALGAPFGTAFINRMFFMPAALHGLYFEYFSTHPLALFGGSELGVIFGSVYDQSSVYVIAQEYWGRMFSPNVGWVGDAYANFGPFGVVLFAIVMAMILNMADGFTSKKSIQPGVAEGLMVGPTLALCSSALGTVLLTHGLVVALIVLWIFGGNWVTKTRNQPALI